MNSEVTKGKAFEQTNEELLSKVKRAKADMRYEVWRQIDPEYMETVARVRISKPSSIAFAEDYMERDANMHLGFRVMVIDMRDDEIISSVVKHPSNGIGCVIGCTYCADARS